MFRYAVLLALLAPISAGAETYHHVLTFPVQTNARAIAATTSDSNYIANRPFLGDAWDSMRISGGAHGVTGWTGDGHQIPGDPAPAGGYGVAITTLGTRFYKIVFATGVDLDTGPLVYMSPSGFPNPPAQNFGPTCMKPESKIASDGDGDWYIFVGCEAPYSVHRFSAYDASAVPTPLATFGAFTAPRHIAVTLDGWTYVTCAPDSGDTPVQRFDPSGNPAGSLPVSNPGAVATDSHGNVYVVDHSLGGVRKFSSDGVELASWTTKALTGIAVSPAPVDDVYCLSDQGYVEKWRLEAATPAQVASWGAVRVRWARWAR